MDLIVADLDKHFNSLRKTGVTETTGNDVVSVENSQKEQYIHPGWGAVRAVNSPFGSIRPMKKTASGISYGQPQFFSPVYTPINWQIPSRRREIYMWQVVDGELLSEDFTYVDIEDLKLGKNAEEINDTVTGGKMYENAGIGKFFSGRGTVRRIERMSIRECISKICYEFQPLGLWKSFSISEEHGVYVIDGKLFSKKRKQESDERYKRRKIKSKTVFPDSFIIRKEAKDISKKDFLLTPVIDCSKNENIDSNWAYLIGLVAADGCLRDVPYSPYVHFTVHINDEQFVCDSVKKIGLIPDSKPHHRSDKARRIYVRNKGNGNILYDFLSQFVVGKLCCKKFTKKVISLGVESLKHVIAGYLDGDGSFAKQGRIVANMVSKDMADQLFHMCHSCGIRASLLRHPFYNNPYNSKNEWVYRLIIPASDIPLISKYMRSNKVPSGFSPPPVRDLRFFYNDVDGTKYLASPIRKIERFEYSGYGYDFQVDPEKSYVISGCSASNCRYFYENEPRVATAIDFYSKFPITGFETECSNRYVKHFFDQMNKDLNLDKWMRLISHEVHLIGDCYPFAEIECPSCGGSGRVGDQVCEHEGGKFKRLIILNPDFVEVFTNPISPDTVICYVPDEELKDMVMRGGPGTKKLSKEVIGMIMAGRPIQLDSLCVSHLKYGESGYKRYGISMLRRLFPILSYKTKIMTAQWIVAERLILPIKVVKVGTEERPAGESDIAAVQSQLMQSANDPNLCLVTHHALDIDFVGASGKILQVNTEYEFINQEILDGFGLNKALITGEGPNYGSAGIGAEIMIRRLESWRLELKRWVEERIYLPVAKMMGFKEKNEWGEEEYIYPKLKWDSLNLRDRQQERQMFLQLYDKGLVSARRVLDEFEIDADTEFEQMRYERIELMAQQPPGAAGQAGGASGGLGDLGGGGGGLSMGGGMPPPGGDLGGGGAPPGGDLGGGAPAGGGAPMGGAPAGGGAPLASSDRQIRMSQTVQTFNEGADPSMYGGKILTRETREKLDRERQKAQKANRPRETGRSSEEFSDGFTRDPHGRVMMTSIEQEIIKGIEQRQRTGQIRHRAFPSFEVSAGSRPYVIDVAFPDIKVAIECDGAIFHDSQEQVQKDHERDRKLNNLGWIVLRFKEKEIKKNFGEVMKTVVNELTKREQWYKEQRKLLEEKRKEEKPE